MGQSFKIGTERRYNKQNKPTIRLDVNVSFSDDAPPALAKAIFEGIALLLTCGTDPAEAEKIARDFQEIAARQQRQADNVARQLLGDSEPLNSDGGE